MSISWTRITKDGRIYLRGRAKDGHEVAVCALAPIIGRTHFLMPVRIACSEIGGHDVFARSIDTHTDGLQAKIRAIDRLALSDVEFGTKFGAARMIVLTPKGGAEDDAWRFARQAIEDLDEYLPLPVVSQIDYDQKRLHKSLGSTLDSIDFAVRHDPSAIATTHAFLALLQSRGLAPGDVTLSVTGVGDLGSRLVSRFLNAGAREIIISDKNMARLQQIAMLPRVRMAEVDEVGRLPCHAHVLSADKSFTDDVGKVWAANPSVQVVGGPEAGLDRFTVARRLLASKGKEYIPSVLCGSLGLVCNLEESLGIRPDLESMSDKYARVIDVLIRRMKEKGKGLADTCEEILDGTSALCSAEREYIGGNVSEKYANLVYGSEATNRKLRTAAAPKKVVGEPGS